MMNQIKKAVEMGERTYTMSQELGLVSEAIEALLLKAECIFFGKTEEALNFVLDAEKLLNILPNSQPNNYSTIVENILMLKLCIYFFRSELLAL